MTMVGNAETHINKSGQALGRKGRDTRRRILEILEPLIEATPLGALSVPAIAREAGVSPSTFYLYFDNVGEAVLAVIDRVEHELQAVADLLTRRWPSARRYEHAYAFVEAYFRCWLRHAQVLKLRNYYADQGDTRFVDLRIRSGNRMIDMLTRKLGRPRQFPGQPDLEPNSIAAVVVVAMERMATVASLQGYPPEAADWERNSKAIAHIVSLIVSSDERAAKRPRSLAPRKRK